MKKVFGILSQYRIIPGIFTIFCLFTLVNSYDNQIVHPELSSAAVDVYNQQADKKITQEQRSQIIKGSINEDTAPRFINHFYDPRTGSGYSSGKIKGLPAKVWAQDQSGPYADYSEGAILFNYKNGNTDEAYKGIGHIIHLIQDMAVPAHTRNDSHADGDPYEKWSGEYGKVNYSKLNFVSVNDLDSVFNELSNYTNNNFYSRKTLDNIISGDKIVERDINGDFVKYILKNNYKIIKVNESLNRDKYYFDFKVHLDYWNQLHPKAVGYSAGVIDYFQKKFAQIDAENEEVSLAQKLKDQWRVAYYELFYDISDSFFFAQNSVENLFKSAEEKYDNTKDFLSYFMEANQEIAENIISKTIDTSGSIKKVLSTKIKDGNKNIQEIVKNTILKLEKPVNAKTDDKTILVMEKKEENEEDIIGSKDKNIVKENKNIFATTTKQITFNFPASGQSNEELDTTILSHPLLLSSSSEALFSFASNILDPNYFVNLNDLGWLISGADISTTSKEGENIIEVKAEKNGVYDATPASYYWVVDTISPVINLIKKPDLYSSSSVAEFEYEIGEASTTMNISVDGNDIATSTSIFIVSDLIEGSHEIRFIASDRAGNSANSFYSWEVDLHSPTTTMSALPATVNGDFQVEWLAEDGSTADGHELAYFVDYKINDGEWTNWLIATTATYSLFNVGLTENKTIHFRGAAVDIFGNRGKWSDVVSTDFKKPNSNHVVISQVQISGYAASDEFIELYNPGNEDVDISGYSLKRKSSSGTEYNLLSLFTTPVIQAHKYHLVVHPKAMSNLYPNEVYSSESYGITSNNTVILYDSENNIVDKIGFGTAGDFESESFTPGPGNYESLLRKRASTSTLDSMLYGHDLYQGNGYDTDNNSNDLVLSDRTVSRNSDSPAEPTNDIVLPEIDNFEVNYTGPNDYSATFRFTSGYHQNIAPGAYYEIRYWPVANDTETCRKNIMWKSAYIVPPDSLPEPKTEADVDISFTIEPEVESMYYCWFMRVYNGLFWSEVGSQAKML